MTLQHATSETAEARTQRIGALIRLTAVLGLAPPLSVETDPATYLVLVADDLEKAAAGDDTAGNAVRALRTFLGALPRGDLWTTPIALLERVELAGFKALPALIAAGARRVSDLQICAGMGSLLCVVRTLRDRANGVRTQEVALMEERLDHIALLADELDASIRRARLDASGHQLHRHVRILQAEAVTADGAASH